MPLLLAPLLFACSGDDDATASTASTGQPTAPSPTGSTGVTDTADTLPGTSTGETGEVEPMQLVREMRVTASIAWDNDKKVVVDPTIGGKLSPSEIVLSLSGVEDEDQCTVRIGLAGFSAEPVVKGAQWRLSIADGLKGKEFPGGAKVVASDCAKQGFDARQYPENPGGAPEYWGSLPWEFTLVGTTLEPQLEDALLAAFGSFVKDEVFQGRLGSEQPYGFVGDPDLEPLSYWFGYAMVDGNVDVTKSGDLANPIRHTDVAAANPGELPSGLYLYDDQAFVAVYPELVRDP